MNSWNFTGNTGGDAIVRFLPNGDAITSFSVAVKAGYGKNEVTSWANCSIYGKRGEAVAPYITKGAQIAVSGEALIRTWEAKDGSKGSSLECRVNDVTLLGKPTGQAGVAPAIQQAAPPADDFEEIIPF